MKRELTDSCDGTLSGPTYAPAGPAGRGRGRGREGAAARGANLAPRRPGKGLSLLVEGATGAGDPSRRGRQPRAHLAGGDGAGGLEPRLVLVLAGAQVRRSFSWVSRWFSRWSFWIAASSLRGSRRHSALCSSRPEDATFAPHPHGQSASVAFEQQIEVLEEVGARELLAAEVGAADDHALALAREVAVAVAALPHPLAPRVAEGAERQEVGDHRVGEAVGGEGGALDGRAALGARGVLGEPRLDAPGAEDVAWGRGMGVVRLGEGAAGMASSSVGGGRHG